MNLARFKRLYIVIRFQSPQSQYHYRTTLDHHSFRPSWFLVAPNGPNCEDLDTALHVNCQRRVFFRGTII